MQNEMSRVTKALLIVILIGAITVLGIYLVEFLLITFDIYPVEFALPNFPFTEIYLVLVIAVTISMARDESAAKRRYRREREGAEGREPRLKGDPVEATPEILAQHDTFELLDADTGNSLGTVSRLFLEELIKVHENWGMDSNDFYIMAETPQFLQESGASTELVQYLEKALAGRDDMTIRWVIYRSWLQIFERHDRTLPTKRRRKGKASLATKAKHWTGFVERSRLGTTWLKILVASGFLMALVHPGKAMVNLLMAGIGLLFAYYASSFVAQTYCAAVKKQVIETVWLAAWAALLLFAGGSTLWGVVIRAWR